MIFLDQTPSTENTDFDYLEGKSVTGSADNSSLNSRCFDQGVLVWNRLESSCRGGVLRSPEVVASGDSSSIIHAVESLAGLASPDVVLNKDLGAGSGVDSIRDVLVVVVEQVTSAETERWSTGVEVEPVVAGIGDVELAGVLSCVAVGVSNERCLPVVVDLAVGDGDEVSRVGSIQQSVIEILVVVTVRAQINVINPDVGGLLNP